MKKILSAALAAIVLAATISGCSDKKEISDTSSENSTAVNNSSDTESTTESTESTTESTPDENSDPEGGDDVVIDNSKLEYPDNQAGRFVKTMLLEDEWAQMELMDAETAPILIPDFSVDDCEEYCMAYCPVITQYLYAIAVKPKAGSEEKVENALAAFYANMENDPKIYLPMQQVSVEGAVMDTTDDGYICIVVHENGQTIRNAIENEQ